MQWFDNIKIRNKLFLLFGILVSIMITFAFFAVTQITNLGNNNNELINSYQARQISIADAIVDIYKMRFADISRGYLLENDSFINVVSRILENYNSSAESFIEHLNDYREMTLADSMYTESEKRQRLAMIGGIEDLFMKYTESTERIKAAVEQMDKDEMIRAYEDAIHSGNNLNDRLEDLRDQIFFTTKKKVFETTENTTRIINMILSVTIVFIFLSALALLFMVKNISQPLLKLENAVVEISAGNLAYPIRNERKDEIGVLSSRIGDMVDMISEHNKTITIMDNLDSIAYVSDFEYNLLFVNKLMAATYKLDIGTCLGQKCYNVIKQLDQPCPGCRMQELLPHKSTFPSKDFEYLWDDVINAWVGGNDSIIRWTDGALVYFRCGRNVSQKKQQEELLQETLQAAETASVAKSSFLANMSHEMRTPMNAVIGFSELILADKENDSRCSECTEELRKIHSSGMTLLNIINDILDISKIESGKFEIIPQDYDLPSLINDTVMLNIARVGERPIKFVLDIDESLPGRLMGDDLRIKQICNNLLSNAFKYTRAGTVTLRIACERDADEDDVWMTITVTDTGVGIKEEDIGKLFHEYSQVDTRSNRSIEGTGLGLSLTKKMAEMMGGSILVKSEYGKGSVFTVNICQKHVTDITIGPVVAESLRNLKYSANKRSTGANLTRIKLPYARILLVDDIRINLEIAKGMMKPYDMQIDCVSSGAEAIEAVRRKDIRYSAIFMDHMMPGMDGVEATRRIREEIGTEYAKTVPIIVLTANAIAGNEEMFLSKGFQAFLSKPIDIMRLDNVIRQWVRDKRMEEALALEQNSDSDRSILSSSINDNNGKYGNESESDTLKNEKKRERDRESSNKLAQKMHSAEASRIENEEQCGKGRLAGWCIEGIDIAAALRKFGDEEILLHVLKTFAEETPALLDQIQGVTRETLRDYTIVVHGLKGSCYGLYAEYLGDQAKKLEDAAKTAQYDYVETNNATFIHDMEIFLGDLNRLLASETGKEEKEAPDQGVLADLLEASRQFDIDGVDKAMAELTSYSYAKDQELVEWLSERVKGMGFKQITQRLSQLL